jgi:hypothetical protein
VADIEDTYATPADNVYKWTIRALYTTAIALNVWFLLENYRDTPEAKRIISRAEKLTKRVTDPWHERKWFRKETTKVHLEAWETVRPEDFVPKDS